MDKSIINTEKILKGFIYLSLVFILAYVFGQAMDLDLKILKQIGFTSLIGILINFFLKYPIFLYLIILISLIIGGIINYYFPFFNKLLEILYNFFDNIINYILGKEDLLINHIIWFWGTLTIIIALYIYYIFKKEKYNYLLPFYLIVLIYYWYVYFNIAYYLLAVFFFLYFILLALNKKNKGELIANITNKSWLKTTILYSLLIVSLALIMPKTYKSISWPWLQNTVYEFFPAIEDWRSSDTYLKGEGDTEEFSLSKTGYQRYSSRLGGPVRISDKKVMTVYGEGPFYLRGNIRHTYTGNMWRTLNYPKEIYLSGQKIDKVPDSQKKYYNYKTIRIKNHFFSSTSLFSPYIPNTVYLNGNYEIELGPDFQLRFPEGRYAGEEYTIKVLEPLPYERLIEMGKNINKTNIENLADYLQIPKAKITGRTKELTREIVKDKSTDYEKAIAIEEYLRKNFKYNTNVEMPPRNREFIDYFLFETKEGYCTYFATTMAIMLRLEGIPSRYVEGYVAQDLVNENTYIVKQKNAHAWVEAFIEPVGWVTFEPTPAFSPILRTNPEPISVTIEEKDEGLIDLDHWKTYRNKNYIASVDTEPNKEVINGERGPGEIEEKESSYKNIPKIIFLSIIIIIILKFLMDFIKKQITKIKVERLPNKERLIYEYNEILKLTKALGYPMKAGETHYEYAHRVAYRFSVFGHTGIQEITDLFVKHKYSIIETKDEDVERMVEFKKSLERRLRRINIFKH